MNSDTSHTSNRNALREWLPHIIWLLACAVGAGALISQLNTLRSDFDGYRVSNESRNRELDEQRIHVRVAVERLSVLLEANTAELKENTKRVENLSQRIKP